jgi:hypothetical protein
MSTYIVSGSVEISVFTRVEADSEEEAIEKAKERDLIGLCWQCASDKEQDDIFVTSGELDGDPLNLKAELEE